MRLLCILFVEYRASAGFDPELDQGTILRMCQTSGHRENESETKRKLATMIERGGYYKNMEANVNQGICFVLGTSLSESYWTKLITKSGPKFNRVLERFKEISLPQIASQYISLRQKVIGAKLESFKNQQDSLLLDYHISPQNVYYENSYQAESLWHHNLA